MTIVAHANTPEELRQVLVTYPAKQATDANERVSSYKTSSHNRAGWRARAAQARELHAFLTHLKIEPKTSVIIPPAPDHTGTAP